MTSVGQAGSSVCHGTARVLENCQLAEKTFRIRLHFPQLARKIEPGQFVMIRLPDHTDPLLGRPFALYDICAEAIDIVYLVIGKLTTALAKLNSNDEVEVWGPLGNGFPDLTGNNHVALVAGGIGQTPFLAETHLLLGSRGYGSIPKRIRAEKVSFYYGVRNQRYLAGLDDFEKAGATLAIATDDGSFGFHGFVTDLLASQLRASPEERPNHILGCGPEPMLKILAALAEHENIPCHVSLETPMACGVGACFSCVTPVRTDDGWDYKRVCVDGPIFCSKDLVWDVH